jgi:hypothetical protein
VQTKNRLGEGEPEPRRDLKCSTYAVPTSLNLLQGFASTRLGPRQSGVNTHHQPPTSSGIDPHSPWCGGGAWSVLRHPAVIRSFFGRDTWMRQGCKLVDHRACSQCYNVLSQVR